MRILVKCGQTMIEAEDHSTGASNRITDSQSLKAIEQYVKSASEAEVKREWPQALRDPK